MLSTGHKAIHNLLHKVEQCALRCGRHSRGCTNTPKITATRSTYRVFAQPFISSHASNEPFEEGRYDLAAGTAWLFARAALTGAFDYLFIDEAGQISLADAIAVSAAAKNIVLLGDPLQLAQVSQGTHPPHAGASILEHLLGDAQTVPEDRGVFLDTSYRMHPDICDFISASVYGGRLHAAHDTKRQRVNSGRLSGAGLRYIPTVHEGNAANPRGSDSHPGGDPGPFMRYGHRRTRHRARDASLRHHRRDAV